jgi:hypothetical protein
MNIFKLLHDERFNVFFSFILGIGIICILRPVCVGAECEVSKPPSEKDFDKYVYRLGAKCYEFKTNITECPASGTIEAFRECSPSRKELFRDQFMRRDTPIQQCD